MVKSASDIVHVPSVALAQAKEIPELFTLAQLMRAALEAGNINPQRTLSHRLPGPCG